MAAIYNKIEVAIRHVFVWPKPTERLKRSKKLSPTIKNSLEKGELNFEGIHVYISVQKAKSKRFAIVGGV